MKKKINFIRPHKSDDKVVIFRILLYACLMSLCLFLFSISENYRGVEGRIITNELSAKTILFNRFRIIKCNFNVKQTNLDY